MSEECTHDMWIWHSPEVFSCMKCHKAMFLENNTGEQGDQRNVVLVTWTQIHQFPS